MRQSVLSAGFLIVAFLGVLVLAGGCSDEENVPSGRYLEVLAVAVNVEGGSPEAGLKVILMDPATNLPVAGPLITDERGEAYFGVMKEQALQLLAFGGVGLQIFSLPPVVKAARQGESGLPLVSPEAQKSPVPIQEFLFRVIAVAQDSLPRISGTVFDASSGNPLDQVFVSLSPYLTGYDGLTDPSDDVTLLDGSFSVSQIPFALNPVTENFFQVSPLRFTRAGFRPVIFTHRPPNGSSELDFRSILIGMERLAPEDTAAVSGRLLRDGLPVAGVGVGIGIVDLPDGEKAGAGLPGWTGMTDAEGRYEISGLPAGTYFLQPGFPVGDGAFFPNQPGIELVELSAGQSVEVTDLIVLHEITPTAPLQGAMVTTPPDSLHWTPVPGATTYEVRFDRGVLPVTYTNAIELPADLVTNSDRHLWFVLAYDDFGEILGASQISARFIYSPVP